VEAALGVVGLVRGVVELVGLDLVPVETPLPGERGTVVVLEAGEGGRDRGRAADQLGAEGVGGDPGEERRVGAAAERDDDPAEVDETLAERDEGLGELLVQDRPTWVSTSSRSATMPE
jgi:hypothetical protein